MSLGETTKCNLSAGCMKVDKAVLAESLDNYYRLLLQQLFELADNYRNDRPSIKQYGGHYSLLGFISHGGRNLEYKIKELRKVAELAYTIPHERDNIQFMENGND